eukprot:scaffold118683_cov17-Tisochrysis_lutea.AAC.1
MLQTPLALLLLCLKGCYMLQMLCSKDAAYSSEGYARDHDTMLLTPLRMNMKFPGYHALAPLKE